MCAKRTKGDNDPQDGENLWAEVVKTVTPAKRDDVLFPASKGDGTKRSLQKISDKAQKKNASIASQGATIASHAGKKSADTRPIDVKPADLRSRQPTERAGIDNASARRMTKGHYEIDGTIDLHGKTEAMAHKALLQFVQQASRNGARTLLIITGKGAGGKGVLRMKVPQWLQDYPLKPHILAISQASPKDGGGGALYVRLRRHRAAGTAPK